MSLGAITKTDRGFEVIVFEDRAKVLCSLQASSLAEYDKPGISAVWLGPWYSRMHLDRGQVRALIYNLKNWLEQDSFSAPVKIMPDGRCDCDQTNYSAMAPALRNASKQPKTKRAVRSTPNTTGMRG